MKTTVLEWFKINYKQLYDQMDGCSHTHSNGNLNPFHLEGSILAHTMLVLDLTSNDINHIFAAVLHDIGKLYTRRETQTLRVSFRNHENVSMVKSIDILKHASTEFDIDILLILKLIAWHGTLWNKTSVKDKLKILDARYGQQHNFLKQLMLFTEADAYGREFSDEFSDSVNFINDQFTHLSEYIPYNTQKFRKQKDLDAIFLIGLSGSGKSTYISTMNIENFEIISTDVYFEKNHRTYDSMDHKKHINKAFSKSINALECAVKDKKNIIVDMTNLTQEFRYNKLKRIPTTQYNHKAIVLLCGEKHLIQNLKKRDGKHLSCEIIDKQITRFELPNYDEFNEINYILT